MRGGKLLKKTHSGGFQHSCWCMWQQRCQFLPRHFKCQESHSACNKTHIYPKTYSRPCHCETHWALSKNLDNSIDTDHSMILFDASIPKWSMPKKVTCIIFRKSKLIDIQLFKQDIMSLLNIPLRWMKVLKPTIMCYFNWQTNALLSNEKPSNGMWDHRHSGIQTLRGNIIRKDTEKKAKDALAENWTFSPQRNQLSAFHCIGKWCQRTRKSYLTHQQASTSVPKYIHELAIENVQKSV